MKKIVLAFISVLFVSAASAQELNNISASFDSLKAAYDKINEMLEDWDKQTIKEICGIPVGTDYQKTKDILYNKYGYPDYNPDKTHVVYTNKKYGGLDFDYIHFLFQSDGHKSYMNSVIFCINAYTLTQARDYQELLHKKLEEKYIMISRTDSKGNKTWYGGTDPTDNQRYGFNIDIMEYEKSLNTKTPYCVRLIYGPYKFVKEEF